MNRGAQPSSFLLPRSSLGLHLPARRGGRRRSRRVGTGTWRLHSGGRASLCDQLIDSLCGEVVVILVVEPHHRGVLAGAQALDLLVAEETVRGNLL